MVTDSEGQVVAEIDKLLYVRRKDKKTPKQSSLDTMLCDSSNARFRRL